MLNIYVGHREHWKELDRSCAYTVMCASGVMATIAESWLAVNGFDKVDIYLRSMGAWRVSH